MLMELPALKLPQIELPFDIPVLLHPPIDHFVIAIPVLVLLIEIVNLFLKKRAIGVLTFFLLIVGMLAAVAAYMTGLVDGKEAFDTLSQTGQEELKEHKLLGTYLMITSAVVVIFKLLSALLRKGIVKAFYLLILIVFVAGILKQGKEGGELVYEYGANVAKVKVLDDELFDCKDELSDTQEELKEAEADKQTTPAPAAPDMPEAQKNNNANQTPKSVDSLIESTQQKVETASKEVLSKVKEKAGSMEMPTAPVAPEAVKIETH